MFRWTALSGRAIAGLLALIGLFLSAASATANQTPGPALPETSLGQPGTPPKNPPSGSKTTKPAPNASGPALPAPSPTQGTPQPTPVSGALPQPTPAPYPQSTSPSPAIPGLGGLMTPNGIALPGGVGFIRPGADSVGVQINTPDGPIEFTVPRRRRNARQQPEEPPPPGSNTDAPLYGQAGAAPTPAVPQASYSAPPIDNDRRLPGETTPPDAGNGRPSRSSREFAHDSRLFHARNYALVLRRVTRALSRDPEDRDLLQLRSLTQLALGDFKAASADAMVVLAQDDVWDWATLRSLYHAADEYTSLYRSLEDRVIASPNAVNLRVLLAYHNLMLGHQDAARRHFERVAALDPSNEVARRMIAAEQPPQPRAEASHMPPSPQSSAARPALIPIPARSRPGSSSAPTTDSPGIDLGQPAPAPGAEPAPPKP
jgi:hypothetical protein